MSVRQQVNKALELRRAEGVLRGSLDASVTLYADSALAQQLRALGDELRFVLITSEVTVADWESAPKTRWTQKDWRCVSSPSRPAVKSVSVAGIAAPMWVSTRHTRRSVAAV